MKANSKQRRIIKWAVFAFLLATLFPPWIYPRNEGAAGYGCFLSPPAHVSIDKSRLMLEWVCILMIAGAACFLLNAETGPASAAPLAAPPPPAARNRKPFSTAKRLTVLGGAVVLLTYATAVTLVAIRQQSKLTDTKESLIKLIQRDNPGVAVLESEDGRIVVPPPRAAKCLTDAEVGLTFDDLIPTVDQLRTNADKGQPEAEHFLGRRYLTGDGVIKDYVEAVKWYRKAAEQGYAPSQSSLGFCCGNGFGVPKDIVQAYLWSNLAAAQGQKEAVQNLALYEKEMTPEQIAEAQRLSREFILRPLPIQEFPGDSQPLTNNPTLRR